MTSRRKFLTGAATVGAGTLALSAFPPIIRRALAVAANNATGTIMDVEHVVILMQENRSFDHYFGTLMGVRGFGDRFTIPLANGRKVWQQGSDAQDTVLLPYHLDHTRGNAQRVSGTPHSWLDAQSAWDGGRMNQWARYKTAASMSYYKQAELPFQFALANAFTICDSYHCGMHTGTNSNRMFHLSGTNGPSGQVSDGLAGVASIDNTWESLIGPSGVGPNWKTYPERLEEAKVSWIVYQNMPNNYGDNPLAGFRQYRRANEAAGARQVLYDGVNAPPAGVTVPAYDPAIDDVTGAGVPNPLYKGIANTLPSGPEIGFLARLRDDVIGGKLRQVSWIVAPSTYSEHPGPSSPVQGGWYTQQVLEALTASAEVWSKTVLIVNFDENDGYFDHVPSPAAPSLNPDGTAAGKTTLPDSVVDLERHTFALVGSTIAPTDGRVYGPGPRVPMYIVSPWSRGGWVNSQVFDHTSVLRFLEARFGVAETNISPFRRAVCGDLTSAFNFATPNAQVLPTLAGPRLKTDADAQRAAQEAPGVAPITPPVDATFPRQATGTRPSRALPYELHTSASVDAAEATVALVFANSGQAAAVFHVYDKHNLSRLPRRYMVESGKSLDDVWNAMTDNDGCYDLWVLGPNGFHRHFKGDVNRVRARNAAHPETGVRYDVASGKVCLDMRNSGRETCTFTVKSMAYRRDGPWAATVAGGATVERSWDLQGSGRWYDFVVTCDADPLFYRRFSGRMENGKDSVSDPAMGMPDLLDL